MSEWWTYSLSSFLLYSPATYQRLFELHNLDWWPAQLAALAVAATIAGLAWRGGRWRDVVAAGLLAACWLWVAWSWHLERYAAINWAATYFAAAFAAQALLLAWAGASGRLQLRAARDAGGRIGLALFAVAVAGWPSIALFAGRGWAHAEVFAIAPDPTAVATLGLAAAASRVRWELLAIPALWCALTGAFLWTMHAPEFWAAPAAAIAALACAAWRSLRRPWNEPWTG